MQVKETETVDVNLTEGQVKIMERDPVLNEYRKQMEQDNSGTEKEEIEMSTNDETGNNYIADTGYTAIIGIGQCGGNIAHMAHGEGFLTCAINTSKEDLAGCNVDLTYEFKNAGGSGKERSRSKNIFATNLDDFNSFFQKNFQDTKNVIIVASAAGGTGGGSAPMCARFLKDNYPNKNIFLIIVLGSILEDIKSQENMLQVMEELNKCEVNYLVFDNDSTDPAKAYERIDRDVIDATKFISRQYFRESNVSNIDVADMQKLYLENKRMVIVSGKFDSKISNKVDPNQQVIDAIYNSSQVKEIVNPMSYAIFLSAKSDERSTMSKLDKEFRSLVDEFGEPYEIYKHYQTGPDDAPDFVVCITGLGDCVERYSVVNERLAEFNERLRESKKLSDVNKVVINARQQTGVTLPEEVEKSTSVNKSSLDMFM